MSGGTQIRPKLTVYNSIPATSAPNTYVFAELLQTSDVARIEEAVRLGDRIAVMSQGGHVEQFATPADLLGRPANDFVADFVGADRGLKRLAVTGIDPADLEHPPVVHVASTLCGFLALRPRSSMA